MSDEAVCPTCGQTYPIRVAHCMNDGTKLVQRRAQAGGMEGVLLDGKYAVHTLIAEGVIGATYLGIQTDVVREVAIKVVRPAYAADPAVAPRFFTAARTAAQLAAPAIATTLDFGRTPEGAIYVVMELARSRSLAQDIGGHPMQVRRVVGIAIQTCEALAAAHAANVIHGDLKPTNILVFDEAARADVVKIADFGLARAVHPDVTQLEAARLTYVSPEMAAGGAIDGRSDLYSLGCILHEALTGKPPFYDASTRGMIERHDREIAPRLPRDVPPNLTKIVTRLLAKTKEQRFENAMAVRNALHAVLGTTPATSFQVADAAAASPRRYASSDKTGPTPPLGSYGARTGITPPLGSIGGRTGITPPMGSGADRTVNEYQPAVLDAQTGIRPAPGYGTQPERTAVIVPGSVEDGSAAKHGIPRILVILMVALFVSAAGILVYLFAI